MVRVATPPVSIRSRAGTATPQLILAKLLECAQSSAALLRPWVSAQPLAPLAPRSFEAKAAEDCAHSKTFARFRPAQHPPTSERGAPVGRAPSSKRAQRR